MFHAQRNMLALSAILLGAPNALAAFTEAIAPVLGPPTSKVTVTGTGFAPDAAVDVFFDTTDLCLSFASAAGAVSCVITVPANAKPQNHWISLRQQSTRTGVQKAYTVRTDMPQFHGRNAAHSGVNPYENTLNVSNVADLDTLWQAPIGGASFVSPVVAGGRVYAAGRDGKLYAFIAATGGPVAGFPVLASPAGITGPSVGNGRVFVGSYDHKLHAYHQNTGAAVSGFPITLPSTIIGPPSLALGNVYVGCADGNIYGFNATTGLAVSGFPVTTTASSHIFGSPTIAGGRLYIGSDNGKIYAFDAVNGTPIPGYPLITGGVVSTVAAASGMGVVGSLDTKIYGFNLASGHFLSGFPMPTGYIVDSSPAIAGDKVFTGSRDANVYAEFTSGSSAWITTLDDSIYGSPMVANGVVYINSDFRLYALSAATGAVRWSAAVEALYGGLNSPVIDDGIVYLTSTDGNIYAFSLKGLPPAARLPGGAAGLRPNIATLKPDSALKPGQPALPPQVEE